MGNGFGNPGTGTKGTVELPVEFFDNFGPAFFHETAITGKADERGYTFEWNRGMAMPGLALLLSRDGTVVQTAYFDEAQLVRALAAILINRVEHPLADSEPGSATAGGLDSEIGPPRRGGPIS